MTPLFCPLWPSCGFIFASNFICAHALEFLGTLRDYVLQVITQQFEILRRYYGYIKDGVTAEDMVNLED